MKSITVDDVSFDGIASIVQNIIADTNNRQKWISLRVNASASAPKVEPFFGASFNIMVNCSSTSYGWGWLQSDNSTSQVYFGRLSEKWAWYKVGKQDDIDALNSRLTSRTMQTGSFDDIIEPGYYFVTTGVTETPTGISNFWRLRVEVFSGSASQYVNKNGTSELYFRSKANNKWSNWHMVQIDSSTPITFTVFNDRISITNQNCFRVGNMVYINIRGKTNQAFTENTMIQGLPTPSKAQYLPVNISGAIVQITASSYSGLIVDGIPSDADFVIAGVYFAG